jgi:tetratricopeptide (TPR) repeat protein
VDTHHHSLRATLDWSYQLLSPELQRFFARLSVFRGGWTLAAAEAVCEEPSALDYLDELRECSLVQAEERAGEMRYRLLETLREYGAEQLTPAERDDLAERHGTYYLALAEQAVPELRGPAQGEWLERLEVEHDNLRATLDGSGNCVAVEAGLQLGWALQPFWAARGYLDEGRERLARLLALPGAAASTAARAKALQSSGILAGLQGDYPAARSRFEEALAIQRELGNRQDVASLLNNLGMVAWHQGDDASSRPLFEESLAIRRESGSKQEISGSLNNLGLIAWNQGDYETARSLFEQSLVLLRELDHTGGIALVLNNLGNVALNQKDYPAARAYCEESLAVAREIGDKRVIAIALYNLGGVALHGGDHAASCSLRQESLVIRHELGDRVGVAECLEGLADAAGQTERAARLLGAAQALRDALGAPVAPAVESGHQDDVAAVRTALGKEAFAAAWAEGQSMALEQAVQYALQERKDEASGDAGT